jgi:hypothetical protein
MDSTDSYADLELIAALIDGRLSDADRARAMTLLAESDEALDVWASAQRGTGTQASDAKVLPISSSPRWRRWQVVIPIAAAAVLAFVLVPRMGLNRSDIALGDDYAKELARDPNFAAGLSAGWENREWSVSRGAAPVRGSAVRPGSAIDPKLAFRLGVRSVDVQVANRAGDTAAARRVTEEVLETLKVVAFSDAVGESFRQLESTLARDPRDLSIQRTSDAERQLREFLGSPMFDFGQWVGAAELAARTHDVPFFSSRRAAMFTGTHGLSSEDIQALRQIEDHVQHGLTDQSFGEVHQLLQSIMRRLGG